MAYKLKVTELAERDLENIYDYISNRLANPTAASAFLDGVAECYAKLAEMPMMFERCRDAQLKERGYRRASSRTMSWSTEFQWMNSAYSYCAISTARVIMKS